jgi:hypothetical protein
LAATATQCRNRDHGQHRMPRARRPLPHPATIFDDEEP